MVNALKRVIIRSDFYSAIGIEMLFVVDCVDKNPHKCPSFHSAFPSSPVTIQVITTHPSNKGIFSCKNILYLVIIEEQSNLLICIFTFTFIILCHWTVSWSSVVHILIINATAIDLNVKNKNNQEEEKVHGHRDSPLATSNNHVHTTMISTSLYYGMLFNWSRRR